MNEAERAEHRAKFSMAPEDVAARLRASGDPEDLLVAELVLLPEEEWLAFVNDYMATSGAGAQG